MKLRYLLLALATASCFSEPVGQFNCVSVGKSDECPTGQVCGEDKLCRNATATCTGNLIRCSSTKLCTDLSSTLNCGDCDNKCAPGDQCVTPPNGGKATCQKFCGSDAPASCPQGGGGFACKNTTTDNSNCGKCGTVCASGTTCKPDATGVGACQVACLAATPDLCSGKCVDSKSDA